MHDTRTICLLTLHTLVLSATNTLLFASDHFSQASIEIISDWIDVEEIFRETNSGSTIDWVNVVDNGRTSGTAKINASVDSTSISQTFNYPDLTKDTNSDGIYDIFDLGLPWSETLAGTQIQAYLGVGTVQFSLSGNYERQQGARDVVMNYSATVTETDVPGTYVGQWFPIDPTNIRTLESNGSILYDRASNTYETVLTMLGSNQDISNASSFQTVDTDSVTLKGLQLPNPAGGYYFEDIALVRSENEYSKQITTGGITYFVRIVDSNDEDSNGIPRLSDTIAFFDTSRVLGDWSNIDWFGLIYTPAQPNDSPWLYHAEMGWLYVPHDQELGSLWMWDQDFGWLWTNNEVYPFLFRNNTKSWLYFWGVQGDQRAFFDFNSQSWISHPDQISGQSLNGGEKFTVLDDLEMIWVEPGTFMMGSPTSEPDRYLDETQHLVTLTKGFWLGKYEVTQSQWRKVMGTSPSRWTGDNLPVERVSWDDAMAFCAKLNEQESAADRLPAGYTYNLPTEAQWEYACRAGTTTATAYGNSLSSTQANFDGNNPYNGGAVGPYLDKTTNVGSYIANAWGFYDMHGNVWEWCADWYGTYPGSVTDPSGLSSGTDRVHRGGGWFFFGELCRSALRVKFTPGFRDDTLGFRLSLRSE